MAEQILHRANIRSGLEHVGGKRMPQHMGSNRFVDAGVLGGQFDHPLIRYGVIGNSQRLKVYWQHAKRLVYKWLNRRSQRRSYNWTSFEAMWQTLDLTVPRVAKRTYLPHPSLHLP